jgi:ATP phosphoribosyltransferase
LAESTLDTLGRAGYIVSGGDRTYRPSINDPMIEAKILRPQEIPLFVGEGLQDVGITGRDWLRETKADVRVLLDLEYSQVRLVLAVPKQWSDVNSLSDLLEKLAKEEKVLRLSTEYLNLATEHLKANPTYKQLFGNLEPVVVTPWWRRGENNKAAVYLSFGATEAKPPEDADAIVEVVETGASMDQNNLKIVETVLESSAVLIANTDALKNPFKREKIYDILTLLKGVVDGRKKLHIFVNVREENVQKLVESLPALKRPTIAPLSEKGWFSVNTVIDKRVFLEILPTLRKLAQGLVVYEPRQVLPLESIDIEEKNHE